jgi:hypothetical protein
MADAEDCMSLTLLYPPTCRWFVAGKRCGEPRARPYPQGYACDPHSPWGRAGLPEPVPPSQSLSRVTGV